jgi:hypothetical protein
MTPTEKTSWRLDPGQIEVVDERVAEILKTKTPAERVLMGCEANETARAILEAHLTSQQPNWDREEVLAEVARRMLGEDLGSGPEQNR